MNQHIERIVRFEFSEPISSPDFWNNRREGMLKVLAGEKDMSAGGTLISAVVLGSKLFSASADETVTEFDQGIQSLRADPIEKVRRFLSKEDYEPETKSLLSHALVGYELMLQDEEKAKQLLKIAVPAFVKIVEGEEKQTAHR